MDPWEKESGRRRWPPPISRSANRIDGNAKVSYYSDNAGLEIDAIIEGYDSSWIALEIKLGSASADAAAESMHRFVKKLDMGRMAPPASLIAITGGGYAITRSDGVHIVPIELLGP